MRKNTLYTVNKWNKPLFANGVYGENGFNGLYGSYENPGMNRFDWGGLAQKDFQNNPWNYTQDYMYGNGPSIEEQYMNSKNGLGISKKNNPFSKGNLSTLTGIASAAGAVTTLDSIGAGLTANKYSSGVGDHLKNVPGLGTLGNIVNLAVGIKTDQAKLDAANAGTSYLNGFRSNASSYDDVQGPANVGTFQDPYKGGWFAKGKARRKNEALQNQRVLAQNWADRSVDNNLMNIGDDQMNTLLANYAAFGGQLGNGQWTMDNGNGQLENEMPAVNYGFMNDWLNTKRKNDKMGTMGRTGDMGTIGNVFADGGGIHIKHPGRLTALKERTGKTEAELWAEGRPEVRKMITFARNARKWHAFGGELGTNGTDFTNGLMYIDAGGSHESNPLGGVPIGVDAEGVPNMVEEGETVFNDYVFSDRMKVPNSMMKELGLGGAVKRGKKNSGMSFAEASKKLAKESEQRPNDPISIAGLEASMSKLAAVQEAERMKKQMREYVGLRAEGGPLNDYTLEGRKLKEVVVTPTAPVAKPTALQNLEALANLTYLEEEEKRRRLLDEMLDDRRERDLERGRIHYYADGGSTDDDKKRKKHWSEYDGDIRMVDGRDAEKGEFHKELRKYNGDMLFNSSNPFYKWLKKLYGFKSGEEMYDWKEKNTSFVSDLENIYDTIKANPSATIYGDVADSFREENIKYNNLDSIAYDALERVRSNYTNKKTAFEKDYPSIPYASRNDPGWRKQWDTSYDGYVGSVNNQAVEGNAVESSAVEEAPRERRTLKDRINGIADRFRERREARQERRAERRAEREAARMQEDATLDQDDYQDEYEERRTLRDRIQDITDRMAERRRQRRENRAERREERNLNREEKRRLREEEREQERIEKEELASLKQQEREQRKAQKLEEKEARRLEKERDDSDDELSWRERRALRREARRAEKAVNESNIRAGVEPGYITNPMLSPEVITPSATRSNTNYQDDDIYFNNGSITEMPEYVVTPPRVNPLQVEASPGSLGLGFPGADISSSSRYTPIAGLSGVPSGLEITEMPQAPVTPADVAPSDNLTNEIVPRYRAEWPRYAGLFGPAVGLGMMAAGVGKPDYRGLDAAMEIANGSPNLAKWQPIGNRLRYTPFDVWSAQNAMNAQARATDRALMNSGSQGSRAAGLLANGYNSQIASGNLLRQAQEYNDQMRRQTAEFNRGTDMYNSEQYAVNSRFNADALNRNRQFRAGLQAQTAAQKMANQADWYNSLYGNVSGIFKGLSELGRENVQTNWRNALITNGVFGGMDKDSLVQSGIAKYKDSSTQKRRRGLMF